MWIGLSLNQLSFDSTIDLKVILTAVGILVAVLVALYFQWWRNRKKLSYEILSNILLISAKKEIEDKVEIRYEGQPVTNVTLIIIKLVNDGYQPIRKDDFEKHVRFVFPDAKILTAEKIKFQPENISTQLTYQDDWLEIAPALFNRKDYVQFKVLLSDYHSRLRIDSRIIGVAQTGKLERLPKKLGWNVAGVIFASAAMVLLGHDLFRSVSVKEYPSIIFDSLFLLVGLSTLLRLSLKRER